MLPPAAAAEFKVRRRLIVPGALGVLALLGLLVLGAWRVGGMGLPNSPPRLSVVVLPFDNLSGSPAETYLADAITDDVTTDLSAMSGMLVAARLTAYTYRGKAVDPREIGDALGVRYVVQGSMRKVGEDLAVNVQLVATESGRQLWAERFQQPVATLNVGQQRIVTRIGETLGVALTDIESARSKRERPTNPDAFDLIIRARSLSFHTMGASDHVSRKDLYDWPSWKITAGAKALD